MNLFMFGKNKNKNKNNLIHLEILNYFINI
jgi:hypothetical protein